MRSKIIILAAFVGFAAGAICEATAQTPRPDVTLQEISPGVFEMRCMSPPDADMDLICFSKIDPDPPRLLGCVDAQELVRTPRGQTRLDLGLLARIDEQNICREIGSETADRLGHVTGTEDHQLAARPWKALEEERTRGGLRSYPGRSADDV